MPKVLLIGWDGAGWKQIHPLLDSGAMPNLARMVENGTMGDLAPLTPLVPSMLWTSVATGHFADAHGVLDTVEADPVTGGIRPVTRASLRAVQIWDVLAQEGLRCQVTGWPASHPAEPPSTCVSDGFVHGVPRSLYPESLAATIEPMRFHPQEWTADELQLFVPELATIDQDKDKRLAQLAVVLAEAVTAHAAATTLLESAPWDFAAVHFRAPGASYELFPPPTDEVYRVVMSGVYRFLDLLLGRLVKLAGPDAITMLVSDRAVGEPEWHSSTGFGSRGILCASGPGIEHDELSFGAGLLDITPTILALFGFHQPWGMPGRILSEICSNVPERFLQSTVPDTQIGSDVALDAGELEALGYSDAVAEGKRGEAAEARTRRNFNLARVLIAQERSAEAIPVLEELVRENPADVERRIFLAHAYFQSARIPECRALCEKLLAESPDSPMAPLTWAHLATAEGKYAEARKHLAASREVYGVSAGLDAAIGLACLQAKSWDEAAGAFRSAIQSNSGMSAAHEGLARALVGLGQYQEAADAALDAIRLRYDRPFAHSVLGTALQALGREKEAAGAFAAGEALRRRTSAV